MTQTQEELREQPVGELLRQLADETTTLVRQELELAKAEMAEKGKRAGIGVGMWGAAGIVGLLGLGAFTAALILALDGAMPNWAAALLVTAVYAVIAGVLYLRGKERVDAVGTPVPEEAIDNIKEDVEWAKTRAKSGRR
jgi:sugar phosphate permease